MTFKSDMDAWVRQTDTRMEAVFKQSTQQVFFIAQEPRGKGGNMPVDTGFLRNSAVGSLNAPASGAPGNPSQVGVAISRAKLGDVIWVGWAANYARAMERRYAFMRLATQQWQRIVNDNTKKLRSMR